MWLLEVLVGHGSAERIECRDAATRKSAACYMFVVSPHDGNPCGAAQASLQDRETTEGQTASDHAERLESRR